MEDEPNNAVFELEEAYRMIESMQNLIFKSASDFSQYIEIRAVNEGRTCTSVILEYCDSKDIEPNEIAKMITRSLKEKIIIDMQEDGLLAKTATLEFE